ncbi:hypothetical protein DFQ26_001594, partial [Actinomortierella ambigua]
MHTRLTTLTFAIALLLSVHAEKTDHQHWPSSDAPDAQVSSSLRSAAPQASKVAFASLHPDPTGHHKASATVAAAGAAAAVAADKTAACSSDSPHSHCPSPPEHESVGHHSTDQHEKLAKGSMGRRRNDKDSITGIEYTSPENAPIAVGGQGETIKLGHVDQDHQDAAHITDSHVIMDEHPSPPHHHSSPSSSPPSPPSTVPLNREKRSQGYDDEDISKLLFGPEKYHHAPVGDAFRTSHDDARVVGDSNSNQNDGSDIRKIIFGPEKYAKAPTAEALRKRYDDAKAAAAADAAAQQQEQQKKKRQAQHEDPSKAPIEKPLVAVSAESKSGEDDAYDYDGDDDGKSVADEFGFKLKPIVDKIKHAFQDEIDGWEDQWVEIEDDVDGLGTFKHAQAGEQAYEGDDDDGNKVEVGAEAVEGGMGDNINEKAAREDEAEERRPPATSTTSSRMNKRAAPAGARQVPKSEHSEDEEVDIHEGLLSKLLGYIPGHHALQDARHHPIEDFVHINQHRQQQRQPNRRPNFYAEAKDN